MASAREHTHAYTYQYCVIKSSNLGFPAAFSGAGLPPRHVKFKAGLFGSAKAETLLFITKKDCALVVGIALRPPNGIDLLYGFVQPAVRQSALSGVITAKFRNSEIALKLSSVALRA